MENDLQTMDNIKNIITNLYTYDGKEPPLLYQLINRIHRFQNLFSLIIEKCEVDVNYQCVFETSFRSFDKNIINLISYFIISDFVHVSQTLSPLFFLTTKLYISKQLETYIQIQTILFIKWIFYLLLNQMT
jgi:formate dehydrogenase maturation protein FdhE